MITFRTLGGLLCLALYRPILAFFEPTLVFIEPALACLDTLLARIGPDVSMIYALLKGGKKSVVLKLYQKQVMSVIYPDGQFRAKYSDAHPLEGVALGVAPRVIIINRKNLDQKRRAV